VQENENKLIMDPDVIVFEETELTMKRTKI
jgi:hypothetical protein